MQKKKALNKKQIILIITAALLIIGALIIITLKFLKINTKFDKSLIEPIKSNVRILEDEKYGDFTTLAKVDAQGQILDDDFKIIAFTDTHIDTYIKKGRHTIELLIKNIVREQPDLVVFVGDTITSSYNKGRAIQLCEMMEGLNVYWAPVFGNHEGDNWLSLTRQEMGNIFSSYPHCLFESDKKTLNNMQEVWGVGNYCINIANSTGIIQSLYFLDGGDRISKKDQKRFDLKSKSYDFVKESQINWYKETVDNISLIANRDVKSMLYVHIPLAEFDHALQDIKRDADGKIQYGVPSINGTIIEYGNAFEKISCAYKKSGEPYSSGIFDAILEKKSTKAVVCGHDHINNFRIKYKGVYLIYNQNSGYSSYNIITEKKGSELIQGYSIYKIDKHGFITFNTVLNKDLYPQAKLLALYK